VTIGYNEVVKLWVTLKRKKKKTSDFDFHETIPKDLISYLKPQFEIFLSHNFWLDAQFKELIETMHEKCVISCVKFFNNILLRPRMKFKQNFGNYLF
jgi:hypothetical protein